MPVSPSSYLIGSIAMGLAQIVDAIVLVRHKNRFALLTAAFSVSEYIWAGVSFFVWRSAEQDFPLWLPASFVAYVSSFMAAGLFLAATQREQARLLPNHLVIAGGVFGVYLAAASAMHL